MMIMFEFMLSVMFLRVCALVLADVDLFVRAVSLLAWADDELVSYLLR